MIQLLNAVRLVTRVVPFLLEDTGDGFAEKYLWQPLPFSTSAQQGPVLQEAPPPGMRRPDVNC